MATAGTSAPILVTGAAGKTGLALIRELGAAARPVRAFVRGPNPELERLAGVELFVGDLRDAAALTTAVEGTSAVYHICPNVHPDEEAIGAALIAAVQAAGPDRFVYHSVLHPQVEAMPHHWSKMRVEGRLFESGLEVTILQPAPYMQNVLAQERSIREEGVYPVPYALTTRVSMVDLAEVAEVAARVLTESGHEGATYELCAPELLDQQEIAAALGRTLGREVTAREVPRSVWRDQASDAGLGPYSIEALTRMFRYYERHGMRGGGRVLATLIGRPPRRWAEFAAREFSSGPTTAAR